MSLVFGAANARSSITSNLVVADLGGQRHPRGQLQRLARQAIRIIAIVAAVNVPAAAADAAPLRAGPGVARALLAIHLLGRAGDHAARLGLVRALPQVGLVHHHRVVQQLLVDARSEIGGLDVVRPHFLSLAIVNGEFWHGSYSLRALVAAATSPSNAC